MITWFATRERERKTIKKRKIECNPDSTTIYISFSTLLLKKSTNSDLYYLGNTTIFTRQERERDLPRLCWRDRLATSSRPDPITQLLLHMSPVLHHDLFSCPCWFCSPSRPSITKIFTRREREGLTTSRQLVVLLVLTTWRTLYELVSSTWRTLEFLLLHEDLGDHSSIQVERDWDDMLNQPCLLLLLRFTEKLPYYITTTGTTWAQLCPDMCSLPVCSIILPISILCPKPHALLCYRCLLELLLPKWHYAALRQL